MDKKPRVIAKHILEHGESYALIVDGNGIVHKTEPTKYSLDKNIWWEERRVLQRAKECIDQLNQIADLKPTE